MFKRFEHKIKHIIIENEPENLIKIDDNNKNQNSLFRLNAAKRIEHQRNSLAKALTSYDKEDWLIYSDSDEIPDLNQINLKHVNDKIVLFNQEVFHYKFNLVLSGHEWFGSKACKIKNLSTISKLRNIKTKKYPWWRIDTFLKDDKFINLKIVNKGGWHFTEIKNANEIFIKHKNDEHHDEFDLTEINVRDIEDMLKNKYIVYDHSADKRDLSKKWNKSNRVYLTKINDNKLPNYLIDNKQKYDKWFD